MQEQDGKLHIKPHKWSFMFLGGGMGFFVLLILASLIPTIFEPMMLVNTLGLLCIALVFFFLRLIVYKKEKYEILENKIVRHYGSIISDNSIEVKLDRVTQVSSILGFIQYKIFKTGNILVKTAGSSSSSIALSNITNTMEVYELLQKNMQANGYHLQKDKLVQEEKPHILGIIAEVLQGAGSVIFIGIYFGISLMSEQNTIAISEISPLLSIAPVVIVLFVVFLVFALKYLDLRRRTYKIFTDTIEYTEGFLTKHYSVLPMERVADSENTQGFFSRLFGMHDVVVSSEGSNSKVVFKNMVNGEQMIKNIKYLKNEITLGEKTVAEGEGEEGKESLVGFKDTTEKSFKYNKTFTGKYKMDPLKTLLSSVLLLVIGFGVIALFGFENMEYIVFPIFIAVIPALKSLPQLLFTSYTVEESSVDSRYKFLRNEHQSFSSDKITMVKIQESLLDLLLGTCSVYFYSIGSSSALVFKNVKKTADFKKNILEKVGIYEEEKKKLLDVQFTLMNFLKANIGTAIFFVVLIVVGGFFLFTLIAFTEQIQGENTIMNSYGIGYAGLIILVCIIFVIKFFYQKLFFSSRFYRQKLAETYIESNKGIFFRIAQYARLDNVKGIHTKKYPLTKAGNMSLRISGEVLEQTKNDKQQFTINSLRVPILYLANIFALHDYFDQVITDTELDKAEQFSSGQDIGNSILFLVLLGVVLTVGSSFVHIAAGIIMFILFAIILGVTVWSVKVRKYVIQKSRILSLGGIIYKTKHSIVFEKFNYIEKNQGLLGKIFKNGNLSVYTLGSGSVDMRMADVDKYHEMYDMLKD